MQSKLSTLKRPLFKFDIENFSLIVFIFVGLLAAFNHSLWRDEMQGWLVAWRSESLFDLWRNNAPSGHPVLWSVLIYMVKDITKSPLSMQLLHWLLGCISILCFWRWNPLPKWQKSLFTFGYFPFWEYYFVCRHYVLAQLFLFCFCSFYSFRRKSYIPSAIFIGLLTNTHAFAWALAFASFFTLLTDFIFNAKQRRIYLSNKYWTFDIIFSLIIILSLCSFSAISLLQVREAVDVVPANLDFRYFLRVIGRIFGGYVLIIPNHHRMLDLLICALITILFIAITISFLRRSRNATLFFISGTGFLFAFNLFIYLGIGSRHYGYYFLILIASIWLSLQPNDDLIENRPKEISVPGSNKYLSGLFPHLLTFCLAVHFSAGIHRALYDFYVPYSAGKATAEYIQEQGWDEKQIFGTRDVEVSTVSGYLKREIYYPELNGLGSYAQWKNRKSVERDDTLLHVNSFFAKNPNTHKLLLILSKRSAFREMNSGDVMIRDDLRITADEKFERSWVNPERFYLYWAEKID